MPSLTGQLSIDLTVVDVEASSSWYCELVDLVPIRTSRDDAGGLVHAVLGHASGMTLGLIAHEESPAATFDERRPGLDHLELIVPSVEEVHSWADRLAELGIEHSGVKSFDHTAGVMVTFRDPDNIQLEFYALKPAASRPA